MDKNRGITEEKDERIAQLERQLFELRESHQQSAATIAVDHTMRSISPTKGKFKPFIHVGGLKIILSIVGLIILVGITFGGSQLLLNAPKQGPVTFVEHIQELSTLATAKAHTKAVIHETDNKTFLNINLPGTKREVLLIVPGTVIAGVDLKGITSDDMAINEKTKEIDITLPHAELVQDVSLQMDKIQTFVNGGLFTGDVKWDEGFNLAAKAQEQSHQDAISGGLLYTAEKNAEKALKEFFKSIGYTVNVTFK